MEETYKNFFQERWEDIFLDPETVIYSSTCTELRPQIFYINLIQKAWRTYQQVTRAKKLLAALREDKIKKDRKTEKKKRKQAAITASEACVPESKPPLLEWAEELKHLLPLREQSEFEHKITKLANHQNPPPLNKVRVKLSVIGSQVKVALDTGPIIEMLIDLPKSTIKAQIERKKFDLGMAVRKNGKVSHRRGIYILEHKPTLPPGVNLKCNVADVLIDGEIVNFFLPSNGEPFKVTNAFLTKREFHLKPPWLVSEVNSKDYKKGITRMLATYDTEQDYLVVINQFYPFFMSISLNIPIQGEIREIADPEKNIMKMKKRPTLYN